jgi:putative oxidoreductase
MQLLCEATKQFGPLIGRMLMAYIFLLSGWGKIWSFSATAANMADRGIPLAEAALVITIVLELVAGVLMVIGWQARFAAAALLLWMIPVTLIFHPYWLFEADQVRMQMIQFNKNLAIMGGLLYVMAFGAGPLSVDSRRR